MEHMYFAYSRVMDRSNGAPLPAMAINQKARRIEEGRTYGTQLAQYSHLDGCGFTDAGNGGSGSRGDSSGADGLGDYLMLILFSFAGVDGDE